ncbi:protein asteroid homolog 1-like isoform X2 [Polyodon spathula]|uniref:protein asteroid homolog 1-like isoform X2 n=1 Tax=Polyodon spathula TaxID=7913 RepID=UPI001B7E4841|nr:protein asteroid homolog 1-like isoform X2 [Polyodon spathula]
MGIHGLTSYVRNNCNFFIDTKLKNTNIIIDGNSLYYHLYFNSGFDIRHGGDYDLFADLVRSFFKQLFLCHINPYVVLDGGDDYTDKKFETLKLRAKDKIRVAHCIAGGSNGSVLPLLTRDVFKTVLFQLKVPFVQCFAEADWEVASLANQWNCPVLANDSDFCVFDLKGGYYPLNDFNWRCTSKCKDSSEFYIPALCFSIDKFCAHFSHMNKALLPLFAVMSGNDYVTLPAMENFFSQVIVRSGDVRNAKKNNRIHGLLTWLSKFEEPGEAIEKVLGYLVDGNKDRVQKCLCLAMEEYKLSESHLAGFFTKGTPLSKVPVVMDMLPDWVVVALGKGKLGPYVINVLVLQRVFLVAQVEDTRLPSSHMCALPIRQVMYGLLLNGRNPSKVGKGAQGKNTVPLVEEYYRHDLTLAKSQVKAVVTGSSESLSLEAIAEVSLPVRLKILLETLGVKPCIVDAVSSHLILPVAVTCYWLTHSAPKPNLMQLQALLMGIVYGELRRLECDAGFTVEPLYTKSLES